MARAESNVVETTNNDCPDFTSLLSTSERDFLMRNNRDHVKIESLREKKIGLYFSASWCRPCLRFTPTLVEVYSELSPKGDFEIIFVSRDENEEIFNAYFSKMPWLAIPYSDSETRSRLDDLFKVTGIPHLVLLDESGKVLTDEGVSIILKHGEKGYPFTHEKIRELTDLEEKARTEESIKPIFIRRSRRDFRVISDGDKVPVSKPQGNAPRRLRSPSIAIIGHGDEVAAQTLKSILNSGDLDFVIGKDGAKVLVTSLVGKTFLLYFSAHWCPPCRAFTPKLIEVYEKIKSKNESFEVVFISSDRDQVSFDEYYSGMPWLALPFGDARKPLLSKIFNVRGIPMLITIGPTGKMVTKETRNLIMAHGADAYPFTDERLKEIETRYEKMALEEGKKTKADENEEGNPEEGWSCDGKVCTRV